MLEEIKRGRLAIKYLFFEMAPVFLAGVAVFIFILLMFQSFRLSEYVIVHGASLTSILKILFYLSISFLPIIFPMSLLFAVLITYGRFSNDSELVAMRALGLSSKHISAPAITIALIASTLSAQTSFSLAPWGNRQMEVLIHRISESKPSLTLREGVFSEGFFDLVVYANSINSKTGILEKVFIYDERAQNSPLTIVAKQGKLINTPTPLGQKAFVRLLNGNIHNTAKGIYTKIDFTSYDLSLFDPVQHTNKRKTPLSYTHNDLQNALSELETHTKEFRVLHTEYHRRWAISFACIIFALCGLGLGAVTNKRSGKSNGLTLSILIVVAYWVFYAAFEGLAKGGTLPVALSVWTPNLLFGSAGLYFIKKNVH